MINKPNKNEARLKRHRRIRRQMAGTPERPRLSIFRSLNHIYAQIIDDTTGNTIVSGSTIDDELKSKLKSGRDKAAAEAVGALIAKKAAERGISNVVFDRSGYLYHGRVKALAEAARKAGLEF